MKIPKHIQDKMHRIAKLHSTANALMREVDEWFRQQGCDEAVIRNGNGMSLEELEYGCDITDEFVQAAKEDFKGAVWLRDSLQ